MWREGQCSGVPIRQQSLVCNLSSTQLDLQRPKSAVCVCVCVSVDVRGWGAQQVKRVLTFGLRNHAPSPPPPPQPSRLQQHWPLHPGAFWLLGQRAREGEHMRGRERSCLFSFVSADRRIIQRVTWKLHRQLNAALKWFESVFSKCCQRFEAYPG